MYRIKVKSSFSAAHNLKNYKGKCEHLHGHNWIVEAVFLYKSLDKDGMAVDFRIAKKLLTDVMDALDHSYLNENKLVSDINPTSENLAKYIFDAIYIQNKSISSIAVWENENSCAIYSKE